MTKGSSVGVKRNANLSNCESELFFWKLRLKVQSHLAIYPNSKVISLAVGDATEPIPQSITCAVEKYVHSLSTREGFSGYGIHQGLESLRTRIVEQLYNGLGVKTSEIFVSDGAKGCLSRLLMMFGSGLTLALQDATYPVINQLCSLFGQNIVYLAKKSEDDFFPDLSNAPRTDLIYFCSPNNPTGIAATKKNLEELVSFAKKNGSIILYDAVYSAFVEDIDCAKSIYEIPGAREVAIEVNSFSKLAGFTGVRLGWSIIPESVVFANGKSVLQDFHKVTLLTAPAGASSIAQAGGLAALSSESFKDVLKIIEHYKENARILLKAFASYGLEAFGGRNSPYIWLKIAGKSSEDVCDEWLERAHVLASPGVFFGPAGEGFLRISAFGHREDIIEAVERLDAIMLPCKSC